MKVFDIKLKERNKGYLGIRRCTVCRDLIDVDLILVKRKFYFLGIPLYTIGTNRCLKCKKCRAILCIDNLWNHYKTYLKTRFNKQMTDDVINSLKEIDEGLKGQGISLNLRDEKDKKTIQYVYESLYKKYGNQKNIEEIVSIYFS